jgi:hypothetical protein
MAASVKCDSAQSELTWRGFTPGKWQDRVDVRDFLQLNYIPYEGDGSFLAGATRRTQDLWQTMHPLLAKEREKGVLDVSQVPAGIMAHAPGYLNKEREIIVGLYLRQSRSSQSRAHPVSGTGRDVFGTEVRGDRHGNRFSDAKTRGRGAASSSCQFWSSAFTPSGCPTTGLPALLRAPAAIRRSSPIQTNSLLPANRISATR